MADLDVSDVLDDPNFATDLALTAATLVTGEDGLAQSYPSGTLFSGIVIPDGGPDLIQTGEGAAVAGDITIYTRWPLTTGTAERGADVVEWAGDPYLVIQAQPWRYGSGYTRAVAKLTTLNSTLVPEARAAGFLDRGAA